MATVILMLAFAMPLASMPVLFKEISDDLGLNLVELGIIWGMSPLAGMLVGLVGGSLGDRFGVRRTLGVACFLAGLTGALRGISGDFTSLTATMFLFGLISGIIPVNGHKVAALLFPQHHLGIANGILSAGIGIGFTVGAMISATVLSPLLGGWRNVLLLYGAISIVISVPWLLIARDIGQTGSPSGDSDTVSVYQAISRVFRIRSIWLLGFILLGYMGCVHGMSGYLPLYLRENGWTAARADGTLAVLNAASTLATIPIALLSDRLGLRKVILLPAMIMTIIGVGLLTVFTGTMVWFLVITVGIVIDGFMAVFITMVQETKGVGTIYAGTAVGLVFTLSQLGGFISPPLGNSLANINSGLPFTFWAVLPTIALLGLYFVKETGRRQKWI